MSWSLAYAVLVLTTVSLLSEGSGGDQEDALLCIIVLSAACHKTAGREILSKLEIKDLDIHVPELDAIYFCFI